MRSIAVLLLLALPLVAGCVQKDPAPPPAATTPPPPSPDEVVLGVLENMSAPTFDRTAAVTRWETFVNTYPKRDWSLPHNDGAAAYLAEELKTAGFETETLTYPFTAPTTNLPATVKVIRGVLAGADPTHRFALVAHYDTHPATAQGAYDDGAGTMVQLEICRLLGAAKAALKHSIECLFFDAEEQGLVASRAHAKAYNDSADRGYSLDLVFGYDMTGINWPGHEWKLYAMIGTQPESLAALTSPFHDFLELVLHRFFDTVIPGAPSGISIMDVHDRNSDEQSFKRHGIPVVRFAGGRNAADYPMYHQPGDTVPFVYQYAGGRPNFEKGFEAVVLSSYYTILGFDAFDPWNLPVA